VRTLSAELQAALYGQESGVVAALLVTITHAELAVPIRISTDKTTRLSTDPLVYGTTSRGNDYLFIGLEVSLPDERSESPPRARMVLTNVGREAIALVRSVVSPPSVKIELVKASAPDVVEAEWPAMDMAAVEYSADTISFELTMDSYALEPFPSGSFDPAYFTGLFAG
jgi:hypothetical protein